MYNNKSLESWKIRQWGILEKQFEFWLMFHLAGMYQIPILLFDSNSHFVEWCEASQLPAFVRT
jgi:hypothetical protein